MFALPMIAFIGTLVVFLREIFPAATSTNRKMR